VRGCNGNGRTATFGFRREEGFGIIACFSDVKPVAVSVHHTLGMPLGKARQQAVRRRENIYKKLIWSTDTFSRDNFPSCASGRDADGGVDFPPRRQFPRLYPAVLERAHL